MMKECWEYYPRYRPSFNSLIEKLQGDVKKNFFSVSWFYNSRQEDGSDNESDSLIPDDDRSGETHALRMGSSHHSSGQHIDEANHDLDLDQIEDDASLVSSHHDKDLVVDIPLRPPKVMNNYTYSPNGDNMATESPLINGHHHQTSGSESEAESSLCESSPPISTNNFISPVSSKPSSSVMSAHTAPPSYNSALDHRILTNDSPTVWSGDGSQSNSCNGSANGHLHFGNQLTSAC